MRTPTVPQCDSTNGEIRFEGQISQPLRCSGRAGHTDSHHTVVLDSDDNAVVERWSKTGATS